MVLGVNEFAHCQISDQKLNNMALHQNPFTRKFSLFENYLSLDEFISALMHILFVRIPVIFRQLQPPLDRFQIGIAIAPE